MKLPVINNPKNIADDIYNEVVSNCDFYVDKNGEAYLVSYNSTGYDLVYVSSPESTKEFMIELYFDQYNQTAKNSDILTAYNTICSLVRKCKDKVPVYTRVGVYNDTFYYDLLSPNGTVVKIENKRVTFVNKVKINDIFFYQDKTMVQQEIPIKSNYTLMDFINEFFNVEEEQKLLLAVYIIAAFIPDISHPILIVEGEKGAGKTTLLSYISKIINPVMKDVFVLPRNNDNLVTALSNNHFSAFDNIGKLSKEFCNTFCQASTGGTLIKRKLYSDNTEICINIKRLVALNGINLEITQSDLLDRAILLRLNRIKPTKRLPDEELNKRFNECLPSILGNIFVTLAMALALYPILKHKEYPRMADFSRYGYAIAEAIGYGYGAEFINAYKTNIRLAVETSVEQNPLIDCLRQFVEEEKSWQGSMTELQHKLKESFKKMYGNSRLPDVLESTPNTLSRQLSTFKHELEELGINVDIGRNTKRYVLVEKIETETYEENTVDIDDVGDKKS